MAGLDLHSRNPAGLYGSASMTPKSRYEQRRFGFEPHYPAANHFDLRLTEERMFQERMHRAAAEEQAQVGGYFPSGYPGYYDIA